MKHLSHELRKCEAELAYLLRSEEPKPVRKYSGILSHQPGRTSLGAIYFDTSSNLLYMDLDYQAFVSSAPVANDLPFYLPRGVESKGNDILTHLQFYTMYILARPDIKILMQKCYSYPFDADCVQNINSDGREFYYVPVTFADVRRRQFNGGGAWTLWMSILCLHGI